MNSARFLLCLLPAIALSFLSCSDKTLLTSAVVSDEENGSEEEIKNFRLQHTRAGKVVWTLVAKKARFVSDDEVWLEGPILKLPSENSSRQTVITSEEGRIDVRTSRVATYGPTFLESPEKKIRAVDVFYDTAEDKISTDKEVLIITGDSEITGTSMVSDSRLEKITIANQRVRIKSQ